MDLLEIVDAGIDPLRVGTGPARAQKPALYGELWKATSALGPQDVLGCAGLGGFCLRQ